MSVKKLKKSMNNDSVDGCGVAVDAHFYRPDTPSVAFGRFKLSNPSSQAVVVSLYAVDCLLGDDVVSVEEFYLYRLPDYAEEIADEVTLEAAESAEFEVSFAAVDVSHVDGEIAVSVTVRINEATLKLNSPVTITMRSRRA